MRQPYISPEIITPDSAKMYLAINKNNRPIASRLVDSYANDMAGGNWKLTHQGLAFYEDGTLADGQHRLLAVIKSNTPTMFMVTRGLDVDTSIAIDQGRTRSISDCIRIGTDNNWITKNEVSIIRAIYGLTQASASTVLSHAPLAEEGIKFVRVHMRTTLRYISTALVKSAVAMAYYKEDHDRLASFCHVLTSGVMESKNDVAAIRLREYLISTLGSSASAATRHSAHLRAQRAIKAFSDRQPIEKLYEPENPIYPAPGV